MTTTLGRVSVNNAHPFSQPPFGFRLSLLLQELMVYAGTLDAYGKSQEVLSKFISVEVSDVQIWRVSEAYSTRLSEQQAAAGPERSLSPVSLSDKLYVEADGSMIFSREEGWREVKVGRLFKASDCLHPDGKPGFIKQSQYLATLEKSKTFCGTMEKLLDDYGARPSQLIFLSDGAPWLRNWISDAVEGAVSILDFYHAAEHLHQFCELHFKDREQAKRWAAVQKELLLRGEVKTAIANIEMQGGGTKAGQALVEYYRSNAERMDYPLLPKYRLRPHRLGRHRIGSSHRGTGMNETLRAAVEFERRRTHVTTQSYLHESAMAQNYSTGQNHKKQTV